MPCELCAFNNPKGTASAVIIRDGKLLLLKRSTEPFLGMWDFPGGYMNAGETPEVALRREVREELGVECEVDFIHWFPGEGVWKDKKFPILDHMYLVELKGDITLNKEENSDFKWFAIKDIRPDDLPFSSGKAMVKFLKEKFTVEFSDVQNLILQLDDSVSIKEINFYRASLNGYVSKKIVDGKLVGLGWIFPRRTLLRASAVIEDMIVDSAARGKGLGKELVLDLMRWAKENNIEVIDLTSGSHRIAANALYKKVGFELHETNHYLYRIK